MQKGQWKAGIQKFTYRYQKIKGSRTGTGFTQELTVSEKLRIAAEWTGISGLAAWLLYDSFFMFFMILPGMPLWFRFRKNSYMDRKKRMHASQFSEGMEALCAAVSAGYSMESAVEESLKDLRRIHGRDNAMMEELHGMAVQISMNRNVEVLFFDMAYRSGIEDAASFAEVFRAARRSGGNLVAIMTETVRMMEEKEAVNREIEVLLAGKRYEQQIMSLIPFGMIAYMRLGSPGYMESLYHTLPGVLVMTFCFGLYGAAVYWGSRTMQIEV